MSGYWRSVLVVVSGTAAAQAIPIIGVLVLARQYAPTEFGAFSAWLGVVLLLSVVLTGRFETALAIEPDGEPRRSAVVFTLATALAAACVAALVVVVTFLVAPGVLSRTPLSLIVVSVPAAFAVAAAQTWQSWAAAEGRYQQLSLMRVAQAASVVLIQIVAGAAHATASALAIAYLLGVVVGLCVSARLIPINGVSGRDVVVRIRSFWRHHRRFPMLSLPADSINAAAAQLPVLIVANRYGAETAGLLAMAMRVMGAPIGLLGKAVLDVFKRHAAKSFRERGECRGDYLRTFRVLAPASLVFCAIMAAAGESLFAFAFGDAWRGAGRIALWLLPLFALGFIASPLSYMVYIAGKQHLDLVWQIALLTMTVATLTLARDGDRALQAYSAGYSFLYIVYLLMSYRFSLGTKDLSP